MHVVPAMTHPQAYRGEYRGFKHENLPGTGVVAMAAVVGIEAVNTIKK